MFKVLFSVIWQGGLYNIFIGIDPQNELAVTKVIMFLQYPWELEVKTLNSLCTVKPGEAYPPRFHSWIYYSKVESVGRCNFQIQQLMDSFFK